MGRAAAAKAAAVHLGGRFAPISAFEVSFYDGLKADITGDRTGGRGRAPFPPEGQVML